MLVIVHDLNLAVQYADRVVMLSKGRIIHYGTPAEVFTREAVYETFAVPVMVTKHPAMECPLIIPTPEPHVNLERF